MGDPGAAVSETVITPEVITGGSTILPDPETIARSRTTYRRLRETTPDNGNAHRSSGRPAKRIPTPKNGPACSSTRRFVPQGSSKRS